MGMYMHVAVEICIVMLISICVGICTQANLSKSYFT